MKRLLVALAIVLAVPAVADAHVGSPDVFYEGDAGPYHLFVTVRVPQVIPGVATIEIRSSSPELTGLAVVPMQLTGPGSQLPPTADPATRSVDDPQFFTASLWLMERGSLQVRITATGSRGEGVLAVPVPAVALRTLAMDRGLGGLLFGLMLLLALSLIAIVGAAVREATLPADAPRPSARRGRIALALASVVVAGIIAFGNWWWTAEADAYAKTVYQPWQLEPKLDGCALTVPARIGDLMEDHGHLMHLFLVRTPGLDQLAHLHPERSDNGDFVQVLPALPAGHYQLFADVVAGGGFPVTGVGEIDLPEHACDRPSGDDTTWGGAALGTVTTNTAALDDDANMIWDRPTTLRAGEALELQFRVADHNGQPVTDLEAYMGMAAHAEIVRSDLSVFAHVHPDGSVAMPALELARGGMDMAHMPGMQTTGSISAALKFPYGFPQPGMYRIFVQVKRGGRIETAAFDARVR